MPWSELFSTVARIVACKWLPFAFRAVLVLVLWLGVAPWCTSWLYRMWLLRASAMVNVNLSDRLDRPHVVADIFAGILLVVTIVFSFLALMSFGDFLRFNLDHIDEDADEHPHHHHHHHHHVQQQQQPVARNHVVEPVAPLLPPPAAVAFDRNDQDPQLDAPLADMNQPRRLGNLDAAAAHDSDDSSDDDDDADEWAAHARRDENDNINDNRDDHPFRDAFLHHPIGDVLAQVRDEVAQPNGGLRRRRPLEGAARANNQNDVPRPVGPVADAPAAPLPPAPRAPGPRINNNVRNNRVPNEWEDDFEHMEINIAVDELLGLRGDVVVLFRNVSWLLAFNGAYLGLFAFIPYTLGSTLLSAGGKIATAIPFDALPFASAFVPSAHADDALPIGAFTLKMLQQAVDDARKNGDCLQLVDLCTCLAGYVSICAAIVLWRFMVTTASSYIHRPLMGGLLWALRCLTAIVKVTTLLLLKMVVLPIVLGVGMDFATLHLFDATAHARIALCMQHMVGSLMVHWVLGITFMLFVTVSVLQLREVVHPDILAKVIRPQEDHPDLLRTLLSETCVKHARRMVLSLVIYAALLVVLIHVPVRVAAALAPSFFPLTLRFQHLSPEIQVPLELLAVHLVVLGVLEHAKNDIGRFQHVAIAFACKHLGLSEYLLPRVDLHARTSGATPRIHVLPPPPLHFHPRAQMPPAQLMIAGHRYLPWPEEGLEDHQPMEYDLLPRATPTHVHTRLAALLLFCWLVCVVVIGNFVFGTLLLGRVCMGPFERLTGITHDPLVMAAGVQITWYIVNGFTALSVLTMPDDHVEAPLLERGYCVKHMSPVNAVTSVLGWAFVCPLLVGYVLASCFPVAESSWTETFWMGYLVFNLAAWLVCCFRMKRARRRRHAHDAPHREHVHDPLDRVGDVDDRLEDDDLDDDDDLDLDDDDLDLDDDDDDDDDDDGARHALDDAPAQAAGAAEATSFVANIRKSYRQLVFNVTVHENDDVRLRRDSIADRCFDTDFFLVHVLKPIVLFLALLIVAPTLLSTFVVAIFASASPAAASQVAASAFGCSVVSIASVVALVRSHAFVTQWMANVCETIRNERYLIGRQLQDMAR